MEQNGGCPALKSAMLKYGVDKFKFEVLIICFDEDLSKFEIEYIKKYETLAPKGYNISEGGEATCGFKGKMHSTETIDKISAFNKKRFADPKEREKSSQLINKLFAERGDEYRMKISEGIKNSPKFKLAKELGLVGGSVKTHTMETRAKISESVKKYFRENTVNRSTADIEKQREAMTKVSGKAVIQYDLNGRQLNEFRSIHEAARQTLVSRTGISRCVAGELTKICGYVFKLKKDVV